MVEEKREFRLRNLREQQEIVERLFEDLSLRDVTLEVKNDVRLALVEGINNAFIHGCRSTDGDVKVSWIINNRSIKIEIADQGGGFSYSPEKFSQRKEPNVLCEGGMGIFLISQVMDEIFFNDKGNILYGLKSW